jgi:hypothetical protein
MGLIVPFAMFMPIAGYWQCGDEVCGYWLGKNCCEHPTHPVDHPHAHDPDGTLLDAHDRDCAFESASGRDYSAGAAHHAVAGAPVILPGSTVDPVICIENRPIRIRDGRGPPDRNLAFLNVSLRAPPVS